jgi:hypothetical protein
LIGVHCPWLEGCHGKEEYRALQFRVTDATVQFDRIQVEYGDHPTPTLTISAGTVMLPSLTVMSLIGSQIPGFSSPVGS